jgi:bifunctional non-homologous end joining protein LigD
MERVMLCQKGDWGSFPQGPNWIFEPKLDGIRLLSAKVGEEVKLVGRSGEDYTSKFPEIAADLRTYPDDFILDGELCSESGDFRELAGRVHLTDPFKISLRAQVDPAVYHAFDLLGLNGKYLVKLPLRERKRGLEALGERGRVRIVRPQPLEELVRLVKEQRIEGIVAKDLDSPYVLERSPSWRKFRPAESFDLPVIGYETSAKPDRPFRSLILLWRGRELQAASGLGEKELRQAFERFRTAQVVRVTREGGREKRYFASPLGQAEVVFTSTPNLPVRFPRVVRLKWDR